MIAFIALVAFLLLAYPRRMDTPLGFGALFYIFVLFIALVYFRPEFFSDTTAYMKMYGEADWSWMSNIDLRAREPKSTTEYGWVFFMLVFKSLGISFRGFSACITVFSIFACFFFTKKSCVAFAGVLQKDSQDALDFYRGHRLELFALYLTFAGLFYNFVAIRSGLSLALLMIATGFLLDRRYAFTLLFVFVSFAIQRMSILGVVPMASLLLLARPIPKKTYIFIWAVLCLLMYVEYFTHVFFGTVGVAIQSVYNSAMTTPLSSTNGFYGDTDSGITRLILFSGYAFFGLIVINAYEEKKRFSTFANLYLITLLLAVFVNGYSAAYRIVDYLFIYMIPFAFFIYAKWFAEKDKKVILIVLNACFFLITWGKYYLVWSVGG